MRKWIFFIVLNLCLANAWGQESVLKEGTWIKLGFVERGIYKLDRSYLQSIGLPLDGIDPKKIQIYGNGGGGMLPQSNSAPRPLGLIENAISVVGESDGVLNDGDYILLYANSPDKFVGNGKEPPVYQKNLYSDTTFYFLTIGKSNGKRVAIEPVANSGTIITTSWDYRIHERDLTNDLGSGREWVGEPFNTTTNKQRTIEFSTPGRLTGSMEIISSVYGRSPQGNTFRVGVNNQEIGEIKTAPYFVEEYGEVGSFAQRQLSTASIVGGDNTTININFEGNSGSTGNLNYLILGYQKRLEFDGANSLFIYDSSNDRVNGTLEISTTSNEALLWNVTDPTQPIKLESRFTQGKIVADFARRSNQQFVMFNPKNAQKPVFARRIPNQDLLSIAVSDAIFIAPESFLPEAQRLASFRQTNDGINVTVVTPNQIYNDFSSGSQDITAIRDFVRYHYNKNNGKLKYLLLFGDASYDYKKRLIVDHNFVPIYESRNSTHRIFSYSSDDYFGFMDDNEGEWLEFNSGDHKLDIGVGRLVVKNISEATQVVNKIIRYSTSTNRLGDWRKRAYFVADDGDFNIHLNQAEELAKNIERNNASYDIGKIYLDAYSQVSVGGARKAAQAADALQNVFDQGALIINFTGHGNESRWTEEGILIEDAIPRFKNRVKLPLVVTATCEFGKYDNPLRLSGGEQMLLNPEGGAIALLTTTRPVFSNTNFVVNEAFYKHVFTSIDGKRPRLGDIIKETKNNSLRGPVNRNFALLGDPTMTLAYPVYDLKIVNKNGATLSIDTLKALGNYTLNGEVRRLDNQLKADYNGTVDIEIRDKPTAKLTLGEESQPTTFEVRESIIFKGTASVNSGKFSFSFVVPKNIGYVSERGKIGLYATPKFGFEDGVGGETNIIVGGSVSNVTADTKAPEVNAFINSDSFVNGQTVPNFPVLIVKTADENGITLTNSGIGQEFHAILDGDQYIALSPFYSADNGTFKSGITQFPLGDLSDGKHSIEINVWDTHNNLTTTTVEFTVGGKNEIAITSLFNYPNPVRERTTISFTHDREGQGLEIQFSIYSLQGKEVYSKVYNIDEAEPTINSIEWNSVNNSGGNVGAGIYIYKIVVQSTSDGSKSEAYQKLIIVN